MNVTSATVSAIVGGVPGMAENPMNGNTPRESWPARNSQRVKPSKPLSCRLDAVAFAYPQDTRLRVFGQRTGRVQHTQDAPGARL